MLIWFVTLYLLFSVGIGLYASTRVHNSRILMWQGVTCRCPSSPRRCSPPFGAETVLGISATFVKEGLGAWWPIRSAPACA